MAQWVASPRAAVSTIRVEAFLPKSKEFMDCYHASGCAETRIRTCTRKSPASSHAHNP
jgi:hypothetical protein